MSEFDIDFDYDGLPRCEAHGCIMIQVNEPICLIDWLVGKVAYRSVRDFLDDGDVAALILDNGFMLPYHNAFWVGEGNPVSLDLGRVAGWKIVDILSMPGVDTVAAELIPPSEDKAILLNLHYGALTYLLFDEEIRKVEL